MQTNLISHIPFYILQYINPHSKHSTHQVWRDHGEGEGIKTINAEKEQLWENIKYVRNTRKQQQTKTVFPTSAYTSYTNAHVQITSGVLA